MRVRFVAKDRRILSIRRTAWVGVAAAATVLLVLAMAGPAAAATATLSGRVTDGIGSPLGGSTIAVDTAGTTSQVAATTTALDGSYSVSVEAGSYDVHVTPPAASGFNPATFADFAISGETALDVVLTNAATATFKGVLQTSRGEAISHATVELISGPQHYSVTTGSTGAFSLAVPPGSYKLDVFDTCSCSPVPTAWSLGLFPITITGDLTQNLTVPVAAVTAQVRDPSGNPVGGTRLEINPSGSGSYVSDAVALWPGGPTNSSYNYNLNATTDSTGNVTFDVLPTSTNDLTLVAVPPASNTTVGQATASNLSITGDTSLTFNLPPVVTFQGVLQTSRGEAISHATVELISGPQHYSVTTGSTGAFSLAVPPGSYKLDVFDTCSCSPVPTAWSLGLFPITITGDLTQNLTVPVAAVTAQVRDPSGNPVGGTRLEINPSGSGSYVSDAVALWPGGPTNSSYNYNLNATTDSTGNVTFDVLPTSTNDLTLVAVPPASNTTVGQATASNLSITGDTSLTFNLPPVVTFQGVLQTSRGEAISHATVELISGPQHYSVTTGSTGAFSLAVPPGSYKLDVFDTCSCSPVPTAWSLGLFPITITGDLTQNLTVPVAAVTAQVRDPSGNPVGGTRLEINPSGSGSYVSDAVALWPGGPTNSSYNYNLNATTDSTGNVTFDVLPTSTNDLTLVAVPPASNTTVGQATASNLSITTDTTIAFLLQSVSVGAPAITEVEPASGPAAGGTAVTIIGTGFSGAGAVKFGSAEAAGFTVNSENSITATSPAGGGTVDVTVANPGGASATSAADRFTYLDPTATVVECAPSSLLAEAQSTCKATVSDTASSGQSTPSGTVSFSSSGSGGFSGGASCTLSQVTTGVAACSLTYTPSGTPAAPVRTDTVTAIYGGGPLHTESDGSAGIEVITPHPSATAVECTPGSLLAGSQSMCKATVSDTASSGQSASTGTVSFSTSGSGSVSGGASCTLSESAAGVASCMVTYTPNATPAAQVRSDTVTATYAGDPLHNGSDGSASVRVTTQHASATVVECAPSSLEAGAQSTTCKATVTDSASAAQSTPTGAVSFGTSGSGSFSGGASCTLSESAAGVASCVVTYTPNGSPAVQVRSDTVTAAYSGDALHTESNGATTVEVITPHSSATTVQCVPSSLVAEDQSTCTATVADSAVSSLSRPTGTVSFSSSGSGGFSISGKCTLSQKRALGGRSELLACLHAKRNPGQPGAPRQNHGHLRGGCAAQRKQRSHGCGSDYAARHRRRPGMRAFIGRGRVAEHLQSHGQRRGRRCPEHAHRQREFLKFRVRKLLWFRSLHAQRKLGRRRELLRHLHAGWNPCCPGALRHDHGCLRRGSAAHRKQRSRERSGAHAAPERRRRRLLAEHLRRGRQADHVHSDGHRQRRGGEEHANRHDKPLKLGRRELLRRRQVHPRRKLRRRGSLLADLHACCNAGDAGALGHHHGRLWRGFSAHAKQRDRRRAGALDHAACKRLVRDRRPEREGGRRRDLLGRKVVEAELAQRRHCSLGLPGVRRQHTQQPAPLRRSVDNKRDEPQTSELGTGPHGGHRLQLDHRIGGNDLRQRAEGLDRQDQLGLCAQPRACGHGYDRGPGLSVEERPGFCMDEAPSGRPSRSSRTAGPSASVRFRVGHYEGRATIRRLSTRVGGVADTRAKPVLRLGLGGARSPPHPHSPKLDRLVSTWQLVRELESDLHQPFRTLVRGPLEADLASVHA